MTTATAKQIAYIENLQADFAYLLDAEKPSDADFARQPHIKAAAEGAVTDKMLAEKFARGEEDLNPFSLPDEERKARKAALKARRAELMEAEIAARVAAASAAWDAKQAALVAPIDDLSSEQASALIDALKAW